MIGITPRRGFPTDRSGFRRFLISALGAFLIAGCGDDIVYRDRGNFNAPADAASGFLGYFDVAAKQTTCGNCHVDYQGDWQTTKHASAHSMLVASNAPKTPACFSCHTVTGKGNSASGSVAGHDKIDHPTYRDVQCESCHGPGLPHVEGVGQGNLVRPLAKVSMTGTGTCGDCHSGAHQPYVEEWSASRHANVSASRATNPSCVSCHEGRGALKAWGEDANFVERDVATAHQPTTCAVCHDPHGSSNSAQLRFSVSDPDPESNLCMRCHMRRGEPDVSQNSPHAPQGAVLLGVAGWRPPGFVYDTARIYGSHATTKNPRLCAGCHVAKFTVTDQLTGAFVFQSTGHLMRPIPCLDANGKPTADKACAYTPAARNWQTCTTAGCHANATVAAAAFNGVRARMKSLTDQLWADLNASGSLQAAPADSGLLPRLRQTRPTEWSTTDNTLTAAEGAEFNARLCGEYGQSNSDNSKGVHNPFLCEALLTATINFVRSHYGLTAAASSAHAVPPASAPVIVGSMHAARASTER